ncbi:MAG: undecaprenyl-diphosphatase UppP [Chloroflexi bacterium]|nr:undecaprenyl-diphosphatase UppP [Chloroflexota bacterium]
MTIFEALILGIIQGATEFLPISSSGHLVILPILFKMPPADLTLVGVLHLGSLIAVLLYFRRDLGGIITAVISGLQQRDPLGTTNARLGWLIVVGTIPAIIPGALLKKPLEALFTSPQGAAFFLLVTAALLIIGERILSGDKAPADMVWKDAIIIGLFQAFALLPGISRSGSTIVGGLQRGLDRPAAARFSFLLGVPVILAAGLLSLGDAFSAEATFSPAVYIAGFLSAAITGYLCIYFLLRWVRNHTLYIFAAYCALMGVGYLLYSLIGP